MRRVLEHTLDIVGNLILILDTLEFMMKSKKWSNKNKSNKQFVFEVSFETYNRHKEKTLKITKNLAGSQF